MLSRVAESIYWMGRQVERAENLARFLEVTLNLTLDSPENLVDPWKPLVQVTADNEYFEEKYGVANKSNVVQFLAFDKHYSNSMVSNLRHARDNARGVREKLSSEAFEQLNEFYHFVTEASQDPDFDPTGKFFDDVRRQTLLWSGVLHSTMGQDTAWHFANVGRMLERADKTSRILDVKYFNLLPSLEHVGTAIDDLQWTALLLAVSGFEAYQRAHHQIEIEKVVGFFLFDKNFPRSVRHCVSSVGWSLGEIENAASDEAPTSNKVGSAIRSTDALRHRLTHTQVKEVLAGGMHQFVDSLQTELNRIGEAVSEDYFPSTTVL